MLGIVLKNAFLILVLTLLVGASTTSGIENTHAPEVENILLKETKNYSLNSCLCAGCFPQPKISSISPVFGERPLLLVLIEFRDQPHTHDVTYYNLLLWDGIPSVRDYYREVSYEKFTYSKAGILGWYKSSYSIKNWQSNLPKMAKEAFQKAANDHSCDFTQFDKNGDNLLTYDELSVIIGISGEDYPNYTPSYAYYSGYGVGKIKTWDGITLEGKYCIVQEWFDWSVYAHELGHSLGLPDLYDNPSAEITGNSYGIGPYDIMCMGGGHFSAWCKIKLGWIKPTVVTNDGYYEIKDVETHSEAYILRNPSHSESEYFLVENRWPGSSYDATFYWVKRGLPDQGIVIYHVDESRLDKYHGGTAEYPNCNNNDETHKLLDIECADKPSSHFVDADDFDAERNIGDKYDLWDKNGYAFFDDSLPCNSRWYDGNRSGIAISVLSSPGPTMKVYFSLSGEVHPPDIQITSPYEGSFYFNDIELWKTPFGRTVIIGPITVEVETALATKVEFYMDNQLKEVDESYPYSWHFDEKIFGKHTIKAVSYNALGNEANDEQEIWIFNI